MKRYKILVFPCGSEIGLEIYRSLRYSAHIELLGANSINDHGKFVYDNYIDGIPYIDSEEVISHLQKIVKEKQIDAIYPTMDKVIWKLKNNEEKLGCKVISSPSETTEICLSKTKTYNYFKDKIKVPKIYKSYVDIDKYPVFLKPDIGYGARGTLIANNEKEIISFISSKNKEDYVISEYLPGEEYTVDCFTDWKGGLKFCGPRTRTRISNGISVNSKPVVKNKPQFIKIANKINDIIKLQGAWFFQLKKDSNNELTLLEIATRLGGSSSLFRGRGVNFALLSIFDAFNISIQILENDYEIEIDRALDIKYKLKLEFSTVYVDFDDCLVINDKINSKLITFLYQAFDNNKKIILISKHDGELESLLKKFRVDTLFDEVIHISKEGKKYKYIHGKDGIFIDDSFSERKEISDNIGMPVFSPDMIEVLNA